MCARLAYLVLRATGKTMGGWRSQFAQLKKKCIAVACTSSPSTREIGPGRPKVHLRPNELEQNLSQEINQPTKKHRGIAVCLHLNGQKKI